LSQSSFADEDLIKSVVRRKRKKIIRIFSRQVIWKSITFSVGGCVKKDEDTKVIHLISLWFEYVCHINYSQSSSQCGLLQVATRQCQSLLDLLTPVWIFSLSNFSSVSQVIWRDQCPKIWLRSHKVSDVIVRRRFNVLCRFWSV